MRINVHVNDVREPLGDLFGIFFEDINHAADGGLYGELVQNRDFEFSPIDQSAYRALTAWEKIEKDGKLDWMIRDAEPVSEKNPHYLVLNITNAGNQVGVRNLGYNSGIAVEEGKNYRFSCYARRRDNYGQPIHIALTDAAGTELCGGDIFPGKQWESHTLKLCSPVSDPCGRLALLVRGEGRVELDFISLFPEDTFLNRKNGLRKDIAELLAELKPKFMRFPGGCLVHDGSLNPNDRDSMYRWKNTIGDITERPGRKNNWGYHQTLGLGYYEYFQFCEDIGAKPIPILPAGYNPHSGQAAPLDEMEPWIDDALDLIEFANGGTDTKWGAVREEMGHPEPFHLEYLGIGNEEVGDAFYERYASIHKAIKAQYPDMKIINSAGPFCAGHAYEKGWNSARQNESELIDEHYYQAPEWFIANHHRYDGYGEKTKVFLGEYGSWGSAWRNCLAEASFMIGLERNAKSVGLACYAPLLCNAEYVNWRPNLIWFNNNQTYGTANYYVQKLFMNHHGSNRLAAVADGMIPSIPTEGAGRISGQISLSANRSKTLFQNIQIINLDTHDEICPDDATIEKDTVHTLADIEWENYSVSFDSKQLGAGWGFNLLFGQKNEKNYYAINVGGWGNTDLFISGRTNGAGSTYTQFPFHVEADRIYAFELQVKKRRLTIRMDGVEMIEYEMAQSYKEPVYYSASRDENGDIIVKLVNLLSEKQSVILEFDGIADAEGVLYAMEGYPADAENTFEQPAHVTPRKHICAVREGKLAFDLPGESFRVYRIRSK